MSAQRVISAAMAVAVGRFNPAGITGYRARSMPDAPLRGTRVEAINDHLNWLDLEETS